MIKLNAKIGVAAVVAALFVAFGAFGLGGVTNTSAGVLPPLQVAQGPCTPNGGTPGAAISGGTVPSGTVLCIRVGISGVGAPITVTQSGTAGTTGSNLTLLRAVAIDNSVVSLTTVEITPWAGDDNADPNIYEQTVATQISYSLIPIPVLHSLAYDLTTTVSCPAENTPNGTFTITAAQAGGSGLPTTSVNITCDTPQSNVLSIKKIDQVGAIKGATFAVQQEVGSLGWVTIATMVTSSSSTASNPCLSSGSCTTNPSSPAAGYLPPWCEQATNTCNGVTLPTGVKLRVIEVGQPANCTLVEIRDGDTDLLVQPVTFSDISTASLNDRTLTWTNSCVLPGGPSGSASSIAVVIGGATFGLSNTTHVEIIPAPGSDDDARIDIRARDVNNVIIPNAHVTVSVDKGRIAMRTDLSGPGPTGYEVIEPAPGGPGFGSRAYGDTCDQTIGQFGGPTANVYLGTNTNPFIASSPSIQDGYTNADGIISACYYVNPDIALGITPGKATVTVIIETPQTPQYIFGSTNIILTASITVVGPPASIKVAASPTSVQCGEKSTITATVTDSVGQNVSDHTRVELVSNFGATIGGTGSTLGFPGVGAVNPLSSSAAETFSGVATAFLLTSTEHVGPYEVVVASGGSVGLIPPGSTQYTAGTGVFSTAPVSAQVTVTCALPVVAAPIAAAPIAAPRTGEGIRPPNTGDAGLADASGNSSTLFIIGGLVAFAVAGLSLKLARR